ncbi:DUF92 domain-containing protein [Raoultibacter phocaeensis]|uniref:DUF92 domain-containing protein n=1 Tax=Raoultibacter phocaeensis TaxID=2479841 RepID=UPI002105EC43|nr:DUF92 domain-containing protein [Raoultibacter phocaeensis]
MGNLAGIVVSIVYIGLVLGASELLSRRGMSSEGTRKVVHIALGGWWIIAMLFFDSPWWAAALPVAFIFVNGYAYRRAKLTFMAREEDDTPGTVYYAVSLTVLALFSFGIGAPYAGALGVFAMAFGDGFAAVVGKRFSARKLPFVQGKSVAGSATMFAVSFAACAAVLLAAGVPFALPIALFLAVTATVIEAFSTEGLDNLWVPLGVSALYVALFLPATPFTPALFGMLLSGIIVMASLRLRLLTVGGGLGALVVGTLAFGIGGWPLWLLLMWFFGSSNIASKIMAKRTGAVTKKAHETRTLKQVLANSVPFLVCALAYVATNDARFLIVSAAALAASTADTWASEIGVFSKNPPINILTGKRMQRGLSGGVSPLGLVATAIGSTTSAFLAMLLFHTFGYAVPTGPDAFFFIIACGILGSLVDSVLGSLLQAKYLRSAGAGGESDGGAGRQAGGGQSLGSAFGGPASGSGSIGGGYAGSAPVLVEKLPRGDRAGYALVSGFAWVTNDAVNLMSGAIVVALGLLLVI